NTLSEAPNVSGCRLSGATGFFAQPAVSDAARHRTSTHLVRDACSLTGFLMCDAAVVRSGAATFRGDRRTKLRTRDRRRRQSHALRCLPDSSAAARVYAPCARALSSGLASAFG